MRSALDYSDFATTPIAMVLIAALWPPANVVTLALIVAGIAIWTFLEYWMHRALHWRRFPAARRLHMHHHASPEEASGGTLYSSAIILTLIALVVVWHSLAPIVWGILAGYMWFIIQHHAMHHNARIVPSSLMAAHDVHHHAGPNRMYGVSTTLWDHVFGTA